MRIQSHRSRIAFVFSSVALFLSGCTDIDAVNSRTDTMNEGVATYYSEAILLNVIRASRSEPLSFVSLTTLQGHNTINGSVGLLDNLRSSHACCAACVVPARNYTFAPNTLSRSAGTDFNASVVDDGPSYQDYSLLSVQQPLDSSSIKAIRANCSSSCSSIVCGSSISMVL